MEQKIQDYIVNAFPCQWIEYSEELRDASELLWSKSKDTKVLNSFPTAQEKPGLTRAYFLTIGFSIENLLKGLLISENPEFLKDGRIEPAISKGHNLEDLALKIKSLEFSKSEINFFKIIGNALPNWSRYPIPKRWEIKSKEMIPDEDFRKQFLELWDKLGLKIYELTKDGWNGPNGVTQNHWRSSYFEGTFDFKIPE